MVGLSLTHMQSITLPVEVVERQSSNLAGAQPVRDHEQQHGEIAPSDDRAALDLVEHTLDGIPADRPRDISHPIVLRDLDQLGEIAG